ncbi:hypothetical protein [Thiobacillus sp.]|uniref:hypothetical protein n=1 Tax=Thiobacillus sp. TaxID=924 RepID=UPI00286E459D|nr:hypothetical protein [Thiobacillus sp.]
MRRLNGDIEHVARTALSLASVPAIEHAAVIDTLHQRLDRAPAIARRDRWIIEAYNLIGAGASTAGILHRALNDFHARAWPHLRHLSAPPENALPLRRAYFLACQAADDAGSGIPVLRHLRRILKNGH